MAVTGSAHHCSSEWRPNGKAGSQDGCHPGGQLPSLSNFAKSGVQLRERDPHLLHQGQDFVLKQEFVLVPLSEREGVSEH